MPNLKSAKLGIVKFFIKSLPGGYGYKKKILNSKKAIFLNYFIDIDWILLSDNK